MRRKLQRQCILRHADAFAVEIEVVPSEVAAEISKYVQILL
jgi:ketopantoate hydroxymethyltransferase